ncbi:hypothetical protein BAP_2115 [Bacillus sp. CN2]|nr:hypothetical protein BAP_2115 [Bacillus sp. CN2]
MIKRLVNGMYMYIMEKKKLPVKTWMEQAMMEVTYQKHLNQQSKN